MWIFSVAGQRGAGIESDPMEQYIAHGDTCSMQSYYCMSHTSENDFEYLQSCAGGVTGEVCGEGGEEVCCCGFPRVRAEEGEGGEEVRGGGWEERMSYTTTDPMQSVMRHTCRGV